MISIILLTMSIGSIIVSYNIGRMQGFKKGLKHSSKGNLKNDAE